MHKNINHEPITKDGLSATTLLGAIVGTITVIPPIAIVAAVVFGDKNQNNKPPPCLDRSTTAAIFTAAGEKNTSIDGSRIYVSLPEAIETGFHIDVCPK